MHKTKEIRLLLMGQTLAENGVIRLAKRGESAYLASGNGVFNALVFGVKQMKRCYDVPKGADALDDARKALSRMGRRIDLQSTPDIPACLKRNSMSNQRLYTADLTDDGRLELSVFMGRTLMGFVGMMLSLRRLASYLPAGYEAVKVELSREERKELRREKRHNRRDHVKKVFRGRKNKEEFIPDTAGEWPSEEVEDVPKEP